MLELLDIKLLDVAFNCIIWLSPYRHMIYAPSAHNSYASAVFPGLSDSLFEAKEGGKSGVWTVVKRQLSIVTSTIHSAAQFLESTI